MENLDRILCGERAIHTTTVSKLLNALARKVEFKLKIQRASIQLIADVAFSVIGFRKNGNRLFVEFYSGKTISIPRVEEMGQRGGRLIYRASLNSIDDINEELIQWILNSYHLTKL